MRLITIASIIVIICAGCGHQQLATKICKCEKLPVLKPNLNVNPFSISGQCNIKAQIDKEKINENYTIRLFFEQPSNLYIQLDHLVLSKAIIAGGNNENFWLNINHKEIDGLWIGNWDKGCADENTESLVFDPAIILDGLGLAYCYENLHGYSVEDGCFVFKSFLPNGIIRKSYIDCCENKRKKIEYINKGRIFLTCDIGKYLKPNKNSDAEFPMNISYTAYDKTKASKAEIKLNFDISTYKAKEYNITFREKFFNPPLDLKCKNIYRMDENGNFIEIK